ncbi:7493_t:CDS:2, partial [Entrophospora sp. SA101]
INALAETLKPIRAAIQELESSCVSLADCYISLIKIAAAFKQLPSDDYKGFRNHCIKVFNESIWKDLGHNQNSCKDLYAQLRKYQLHSEPYDAPFSDNYDTPYSWWMTCNDQTDNLKKLALKIFAVTPSSACCERIFSSLGWFYGKRHQNLSLEKLEAMAKIHRYYITDAKKELGFVAQDKSENDVRSWINAAYNTLEEDDDENNDSILELLPENNDDSEPSDDIELELERILSLNEVFVVINNNDYVTANQEENTNSEATEEIEDYDPAQLASNYLSDLE